MYRRTWVRSLIVVGVSMVVMTGCELAPGVAPRSVPLYQLLDGTVSPEAARTLAARLDWENLQTLREDGAITWVDPNGFQAVPLLAPVDVSGAEDAGTTQASAFDRDAVQALPDPIGTEEAVSTTDQALVAAGLDPRERLANVEAVVTPRVGHSRFQWVDTTGASQADVLLDTHVDYAISLPGGDVAEVPVIGPGASIKIVMDPTARATLLHYEMWNLELGETIEVLSEVAAEEACGDALWGTEGITTRLVAPRRDAVAATADLVYYAPSFSDPVATMYPYFACGGTVQIGDTTLELRTTLIPAGDGVPELFAADVAPSTRGLHPQLAPSQSVGDVDVGSEWVGESQGLGGSAANAGGFVSHFDARSEPVRFDWGDFNAWEQDFKDPAFGGDDANWVDSVDAVFYTGHADGNGFTFPGTNDDGSLFYGEARWGQGDLEWLVIAACGPLQESTAQGQWYERWGPAFDGLHLLLAYANVSNDNVMEGTYFARGLTGDLFFLSALPVRISWSLAAILVQPNSVTLAYMGVSGEGDLTNYDDYFWGQPPGGGTDITPDKITGYWMVHSPS